MAELLRERTQQEAKTTAQQLDRPTTTSLPLETMATTANESEEPQAIGDTTH